MPSYKTGFYSPKRRLGIPRYPELWDGCVGAWCPSLGQTGYILKDMSVYGNDGVLYGATPDSLWRIYEKNYSANFSGASSEIIRLGSVPILQFTTSDSFSGSAWIYPTTLGLFNTIFGIRNGGNYDYQFRNNSSSLSLLVSGGAVAGGTIPINVWSHVCFTYDKGSVKVYLNKVQVASATGRSISSTATEFTIGNELSLTQQFYGGIDDIRMYSRALSEKEVYILSKSRGIAYEYMPRKSYSFLSSSNINTASKRLTISNLTLPFRMVSAAPNSVSTAGDRKADGYLYTGLDAESSGSSLFYNIFKPFIFKG